MKMFIIVAVALLSLSSSAQAARICVEEAAGVCLKFEERPKAAVRSKPAASPAAAVESALRLTPAERSAVQAGLTSRGYDAGAVDGVFGAGTRRALARWQADQGATPTGYLTLAQMRALSSPAAALIEEETPGALSVSPPAATSSPSPTAPAQAAAAPAPAQPIKPRPGELYSHLIPTAHTSRVLVEAQVDAAGEMEIWIKRENRNGALQKLRPRCRTPVNAPFSCDFRWGTGRYRLSGAPPNVVLDNTGGFGKPASIKLW